MKTPNTRGTRSARAILLVALVPTAVLAAMQIPNAPVTVVGQFSNMRFTEEHAYGYSVQLWRQGNTIFGLFEATEGLIGDTPAGLLEDVKFDPLAGKLSFKARLSMGVALLGPGKQVRSRDLFEFQGTLGKTTLVGTLKRSDMLQPKVPPQVRQIRLRKRPTDLMTQPASYAEWKRSIEEILKFRGPKW